MKHKSKFVAPAMCAESCVNLEESKKIFHPLSEYLRQRVVDVDGDALKMTADVEFDNEEQLSELESEGAMSVPYGDPRVSKFDLVERYGKYAADKASSKSPKGTVSSDETNKLTE